MSKAVGRKSGEARKIMEGTAEVKPGERIKDDCGLQGTGYRGQGDATPRAEMRRFGGRGGVADDALTDDGTGG
jgi:hypothetical protein